MKFKKLLSILIALGIVAGLTACGEKEQPKEPEQTEVQEEVTEPVEEENERIPNPVVSYDTVEDAVIQVGHLSPLPSIYERYFKDAAVIDNTLIQITYSNDEGRVLTLREEEGLSDDISGNYNLYPYSDFIDVNGMQVMVKGESEDSISVVTWNDGAYAHSLDYDSGVTLEEVRDVVNEING
jgi:hypothetical protein